MALFRSRKAAEPSAPPAPAESMESLRRRARQRLIGAALLVLAGLIAFPLLFDSQPRPVAVDLPIDIPDRNRVPPLVMPEPAAPPASAPPAATPSRAAPAVNPVPGPVPSGPTATKTGVVGATPTVAPAPPAVAPPPAVASPPAVARPAVTAPPAAAGTTTAAGPASRPAGDDGARARALLEGREPPAPAVAGAARPPATAVAAASGGGERLIVQVGAFADPAKAREVRQTLERAGLKTYTQVVQTPDGERTRVRVGPFASRAEAERAAQRVRALELPAAILAL